jgi:hypothetical protein
MTVSEREWLSAQFFNLNTYSVVVVILIPEFFTVKMPDGFLRLFWEMSDGWKNWS